mmetsp:Transcript_17985/g.53266  ORF Transcript_17985/g.53266 Transcript_17985/m.53266 type:complete len:293 (-) Transcript_17985:2597-3475(-)
MAAVLRGLLWAQGMKAAALAPGTRAAMARTGVRSAQTGAVRSPPRWGPRTAPWRGHRADGGGAALCTALSLFRQAAPRMAGQSRQAVARLSSSAKVVKHSGTRRYRGIIAITTVTGAVGAFCYTAFKASNYVSGLNLKHGVAFGLYCGGAVSALAVVGGAVFLRRFLAIHPETLFGEVSKRVAKDPSVATLLGSRPNPGKFKAYAYKGGLVFKDRSVRRSLLDAVSYERYGLQLMYQINSDDTMAMVSAEATQSILGGYEITNLAVDFQNGERVVLTGDTKDVVFKGVVKLR